MQAAKELERLKQKIESGDLPSDSPSGICKNCQQTFPLDELTLTVDPALEDLTGDEEENYYCKSCMEEMPKEL